MVPTQASMGYYGELSGVREGELYSLESRSALLPSSPFCQIVQLSDFYSPALQCMVSHPPPKRDIECHVLLLSGTKEKIRKHFQSREEDMC